MNGVPAIGAIATVASTATQSAVMMERFAGVAMTSPMRASESSARLEKVAAKRLLARYSFRMRVQAAPESLMVSGPTLREAARSAGSCEAESRAPKALSICQVPKET